MIYKLILLSAILSFFVTFMFTKKFIKVATLKGLTGIDVHKIGKVIVPEFGGFGIFLGFLFGISLLFPFSSISSVLLITLLSVSLATIIGSIDDLVELSIIKKLIFIGVASIPLIISRSGDTLITLPFIAQIDIGLLYYFIFIPLFFMVVTNMTNLLAGYNGLESYMGIITLTSVSIYLMLGSNFSILQITLPMIFALLAFLHFNKYPAKIFMGDVGTLAIGATLASIGIIYHMEVIVLLLSIPYLIHFGLYAIYTFIFRQKWGDPKISKVDKEGYLTPMYFKSGKPAWHKLYFLLEHLFKPLTEKGMVKILTISQILLNVLVIILLKIV